EVEPRSWFLSESSAAGCDASAGEAPQIEKETKSEAPPRTPGHERGGTDHAGLRLLPAPESPRCPVDRRGQPLWPDADRILPRRGCPRAASGEGETGRHAVPAGRPAASGHLRHEAR